MRPALRSPLRIPVPDEGNEEIGIKPLTTAPTENEVGAMILIAALMSMLGSDEVILDEPDVNLAIKMMQEKRLVVMQNDADKTVMVSWEKK